MAAARRTRCFFTGESSGGNYRERALAPLATKITLCRSPFVVLPPSAWRMCGCGKLKLLYAVVLPLAVDEFHYRLFHLHLLAPRARYPRRGFRRRVYAHLTPEVLDRRRKIEVGHRCF